jgi:hypothetical protein
MAFSDGSADHLFVLKMTVYTEYKGSVETSFAFPFCDKRIPFSSLFSVALDNMGTFDTSL